jgi:hypothetical protein
MVDEQEKKKMCRMFLCMKEKKMFKVQIGDKS